MPSTHEAGDSGAHDPHCGSTLEIARNQELSAKTSHTWIMFHIVRAFSTPTWCFVFTNQKTRCIVVRTTLNPVYDPVEKFGVLESDGR